MIGCSVPVGDKLNYFQTRDGKYCMTVRHLFGATYVDTIDELTAIYQPMIDWLQDNIKGSYELSPMDNCAYSDVNEDPLIGYYIYFKNETDAMAFKLRWGGI